jgi:signal transduction histidine kinase
LAIEKPAAHVKKLDLLCECDKSVPAVLIGDSYRLMRVLINLISNSIKFTDAGHIRLTISAAKAESRRRIVLRFIVEDTGIGMPQDKQDFIYEKFVRLSAANRGTYRGMGLGLRIVKQFMEEMNGDIELDSKPGSGTCFACVLPFKIPLIS